MIGELKMKIKFETKTIEISKTFAEKASRFRSEQYEMLRIALNDLPDFMVVIKTTPPRRSYARGLTLVSLTDNFAA